MAGRGERAPVERQGVGFVQYKFGPVGIARPQNACEIAIDFDRIELAGGIEQLLRECPLPRSDLDRRIGGSELYRGDDSGNDGRIVQKVLAEALAGAAVRTAQEVSLTDAMRAASSIAATRLPASALPLPARSSAVP